MKLTEALFRIANEGLKDPELSKEFDKIHRVLEAAGRVDKLLALASIDAVRRVLVNDGMPGVEREMRDIRALLSALPGEPK
jgi:hypothetical protein